MKTFLCSLLFLGFIENPSAQQDTILVYLDKDEKPCSPQQARYYSLQHKDRSAWKKLVFDIADDKVEYVAYFLDSFCTKMEGPYISFHKNGQYKTSGRYLQDKKTGAWLSWTENKKLVDSAFYKNGFIHGLALKWSNNGIVSDSLFFGEEGNGEGRGYWPDGKRRYQGHFISGKKCGQWTYYHKNGNPSQVTLYANDSVGSYTCYDEEGKLQKKDCYYEKEASYKGGDKAWMNYLSRRLSIVKLPAAYYSGEIFGTTMLQFIVDVDGRLTDIKVVKSVDPELDEIALDIIRQSPKWEPAVQYNRKIKAYRKQPITFSQPQ